jgi:hypothetical protein
MINFRLTSSGWSAIALGVASGIVFSAPAAHAAIFTGTIFATPENGTERQVGSFAYDDQVTFDYTFYNGLDSDEGPVVFDVTEFSFQSLAFADVTYSAADVGFFPVDIFTRFDYVLGYDPSRAAFVMEIADSIQPFAFFETGCRDVPGEPAPACDYRLTLQPGPGQRVGEEARLSRTFEPTETFPLTYRIALDEPQAVPEPSALLGLGLLGGGLFRFGQALRKE